MQIAKVRWLKRDRLNSCETYRPAGQNLGLPGVRGDNQPLLISTKFRSADRPRTSGSPSACQECRVRVAQARDERARFGKGLEGEGVDKEGHSVVARHLGSVRSRRSYRSCFLPSLSCPSQLACISVSFTISCVWTCLLCHYIRNKLYRKQNRRLRVAT